jgi:hypothetical protein
MNDERTCTQSGAKLTHSCSGDVHGWTAARAALILKREAVGADTPTGLNISTLVEQIERRPTYVRPEWAKDRRQTLDYQIEKSLARLAGGM